MIGACRECPTRGVSLPVSAAGSPAKGRRWLQISAGSLWVNILARFGMVCFTVDVVQGSRVTAAEPAVDGRDLFDYVMR